MKRKRGQTDFDVSEPEFLISVMNRHPDWCAIVCLVGEGQEINTGEAGISEWIGTLQVRFHDWDVHISPHILLPEYGSGIEAEKFLASSRVRSNEHLHLAVSMRSFRAEALSGFVSDLIENRPKSARDAYTSIETTYPIHLTRDLSVARAWLRNRARGTERFGLVASSGAQRLRPEGIHIKAEIVPANWFLNESTDVRSSTIWRMLQANLLSKVLSSIGSAYVGTATFTTMVKSGSARRSKERGGSTSTTSSIDLFEKCLSGNTDELGREW